MSMTTVANPRTPGPPHKPQPHHPATTNQTMAINPYPLTAAPPYEPLLHMGDGGVIGQGSPALGRVTAL